jgi:flagellar basal-body rod modification protein FlgD
MSQISALGQTSQEITTNYLNLLVAQLQNQNPLEPMDNNEMAGQLAQLSALEQQEKLNKNFTKVLEAVQLQEATTLTGKEVSYMADETAEDGSTYQVPKLGQIGTVAMEDGELRLFLTNGKELSTSEIYSVGRDPVSTALTEGATLIGKEVTFLARDPEDPTGSVEVTREVTSVKLEDGDLTFIADDGTWQYQFGASAIVAIGS